MADCNNSLIIPLQSAMTLYVYVVTSFLMIYLVFSDIIDDLDFYEGASFPKKYLEPEDVVPTVDDITVYLTGLKKLVDAMAVKPNETSPSQGLGLFYTRTILKRTLKENMKKIRHDHYKSIHEILKQIDNVMSHFHYPLKEKNWSYELKRVAELFLDDSLQVESISDYNTHRLKDIILSSTEIHEFAQEMDEAKLPKEKYLELVLEIKYYNYTISMDDSDYCLGQIVYNPVPKDDKHWPCRDDSGCASVLYTSPSVAYGLSHRLLNLMLPRHVRRCYMSSEESDDALMDVMCAWMYRETVYLARRGYFFRDIFMEHVALCSFLGYKEFHRRHWFYKIVSWIDDDGCMQENMNFEYNRTAVLIKQERTADGINKLREMMRNMKNLRCFFHQMVLGAMMLAHGVRYSVYFGDNLNLNYTSKV